MLNGDGTLGKRFADCNDATAFSFQIRRRTPRVQPLLKGANEIHHRIATLKTSRLSVFAPVSP
jgi:hypothetical protein